MYDKQINPPNKQNGNLKIDKLINKNTTFQNIWDTEKKKFLEKIQSSVNYPSLLRKRTTN